MRRRQSNKIEILQDPKYSSVTLAKFINTLIVSGKKTIAENIVYGALKTLEEKTQENGLKAFNIQPSAYFKNGSC